MFWVPLTVMFLLTGSLAMMNDGLRDAFDPSSSSAGKARKAKARQPAAPMATVQKKAS
jgi:peptide/nickel transport system permease protein